MLKCTIKLIGSANLNTTTTNKSHDDNTTNDSDNNKNDNNSMSLSVFVSPMIISQENPLASAKVLFINVWFSLYTYIYVCNRFIFCRRKFDITLNTICICLYLFINTFILHTYTLALT